MQPAKRRKTGNNWDWEKKFDVAACATEFGWTDDDWILGVDEAGRGPVLGSMVYGCMACQVKDHEGLRAMGVADSKDLKKDKRNEIFAAMEAQAAGSSEEAEKVEGKFAYLLREISATEISKLQLARKSVSLNKISHDAAIELITRMRALIRKSGRGKLVAAFVDVVGPQDSYQRKLEHFFPELVVCVKKKADSTFPIVGGASVMAKVTRDTLIENYVLPETGERVGPAGSGYPGDAGTKLWLSRNAHKVFVFPEVVRFDWQPAKDIEKAKCVSIAWDGNGEDLPELFDSKAPKRWQYFQEMFLSRPASF
ncbi:Ribonuclease H2 subunit A [Diplonema papillatum]|nr:Ribonuclease H2 subunit A [Diplonema papillatum]